MARYVVTGAAGFIGSRVAGQLLGSGHQVVGIDNLNDAYDVRLKQHRLEHVGQEPGFTFLQEDITHREELASLWKRYDLGTCAAVINLAARAGVRQSVRDPGAYFDTNVSGTLNLLELCRQSGARKFVLASTSSLYGQHNPLPFSESADTSRPLSPYAASKQAAEALCHSYHHVHGLDVTVLRYFTVYGPAGRPDMSPFRFTQWISEGRPVRIFGDGTQSRDFTYVDDIAEGTVLAVQSLGWEVINLGSDRPWSLLDMVRELEGLIGQPAKLEFQPAQRTDTPATWASVDHARSILGWAPQVDFKEGLARLVAWYHENRAWASEVGTDE